MEMVDTGDMAELVWPECCKPYFQQVTKYEEGVKIARMSLCRMPYVADEEETLMNLLQRIGAVLSAHNDSESGCADVTIYSNAVQLINSIDEFILYRLNHFRTKLCYVPLLSVQRVKEEFGL